MIKNKCGNSKCNGIFIDAETLQVTKCDDCGIYPCDQTAANIVNNLLNTVGTPKTLLEAIDNARADFNVSGHYSTTKENVIKAHVKDFLAQRFNVAMLENPEIDSVLIELYKNITE